MNLAIGNALPTQAAATPAVSAAKVAPAAPATHAATPAVIVQISSAAAAMAKELTETSVQTAQEAGAGDVQAKHLLAKEAAEKAH